MCASVLLGCRNVLSKIVSSVVHSCVALEVSASGLLHVAQRNGKF